MPNGIRLPRNLFRRVRSQTAQFRATTGRDIHPALLEKLLEAETSAILDKQLGIREQESREKFRAGQLELAEEQAEAQGAAATVGGLAQLGTTAFIGRELLRKGVPAVAGGTAAAPTVAAGAQEVTAGLATGVTGAAPQVAPTVAGAEVGVSGAATSAGTATTAAGAGATATTAAAPGLLSSATGVLGPAALGATAGQLIFGGESGLIGKGETTQTAGAIGGGAIAGALVGAKIGAVGGPVGAVIGAGVGLVVNTVSGGSVICEELNRQGYIPDNILKLDGEFRGEYISDEVYKGYIAWASTVVKWMKKYPAVTTIARPIGVAWAYEMAHRKDPTICDGNILGKVLLRVGVPICWVINKIKEIYVGGK